MIEKSVAVPPGLLRYFFGATGSSRPPASRGQLRPTAPPSGVCPKQGVKNIIYLSSPYYAHSKKMGGLSQRHKRNAKVAECSYQFLCLRSLGYALAYFA